MRLLWHVNFWDGPLCGICLHEGRKYWFKLDKELDDRDRSRSFNVYYLTDEQINLEDSSHELWCKYVGTHCDYDENGKRDHGTLKSTYRIGLDRFKAEKPVIDRSQYALFKSSVPEAELRGPLWAKTESESI